MTTGSIDRRVARTRRLLQEALFDLTAENGYAAVKVEDICRRADVGRSTFYTHYADKDSLRRAAIKEHLEAMHENGDASVSKPSLNSFAFSGPAFAHADATRKMHRAMMGGKQREIPKEIRDWISKQVRRELLSMAGKEAIGVEVATRFVTGGFFEVMHWWLDARAGLPPAEINRLFQTLAFDGAKKLLAPAA